MNTRRPLYHRHRFPPEIISHAVWLYHRYCMSFRDVEDLLAERGIIVSYETVRQWCGKFGASAINCCYPSPYLVLTKPLRLDIQCQRAASVKIGWKYLDD